MVTAVYAGEFDPFPSCAYGNDPRPAVEGHQRFEAAAPDYPAPETPFQKGDCP